MTRQSRLFTLLTCCGVIFTDMVGYGVITPSVPIFAKLLKASDAEIGLALSAYSVAFILVILPFGYFVDKVGRNDLVIGLGMLCLAVSSLTLIFTTSIWVLVTARAFQGAASAISWVAAQPLASKSTEGSKRKGLEISLISTAFGLGLIAGPLIGGVGDFKTPFIICFALAMSFSVTSFFGLPKQGKVDAVSYNRKGIIAFLKNSGIFIGCLSIFSIYCCIGMAEVLFPLYMDSLSFLKSDIGFLFGILSISLTLSQPLIGIAIGRFGTNPVIFSGSLMTAVSLSMMVNFSSFNLWIPVFIILGIAMGTLVTTSMYLISKSSIQGEQGMAYGLWNLSFSIGYLIGPSLGGIISNLSNIKIPFYFFGWATFALIAVSVVKQKNIQ